MAYVTEVKVFGVEEDTNKAFDDIVFATRTEYKLSEKQLNMLIATLIDSYDSTIGTHKPIEFINYTTEVLSFNLEI